MVYTSPMAGRSASSGARRLAVAGLAVAVGALPAACGSEDEKKSTRLVAAGTKLNRLEVAGTEKGGGHFQYRATRTVREGLVEIRFKNAGKSPRKAQLWKVGAGRSVEEALRIRRRSLPRWLEWAGGVGLVAPGRTGTSVQPLLAGTYYVTGIGSERRGVAPVKVTAGDASPKLASAADARITSIDYGYRTAGLAAGPASVEFRNTGREPHHAFMVPLREGRTLAEARDFFAGKSSGPPPVDPEATRETAVLEGGESQVTHLNLQSGRYAVLCFVRDRRGGPQHVEKGMVAEVEVP
jgi:hypothetical protein